MTYLRPELLLSLWIALLLVIRLGTEWKNASLLGFIQFILVINFAAGLLPASSGNCFGDMYQTNPLILFEKNMLNGGVLLLSLLFGDWLKRCEHRAEFYILLLSALMGMFFLLSSGHLLMFYLSVELATIPVAALANFQMERRLSSEAAIKMILSSAFASGILLFGISLFYGTTGSLSLTKLPQLLQANPLQLLAFVFLFTSFGFKMSVVPFHLWTADVYEGAPVPVTAFLSVISKGAIAFVLVAVLYKIFPGFHQAWYPMLLVTSVMTMLIGNLFALRQQSLKRFLAFSSVAQVGFILLGISGQSANSSSAVIYFILIYLFSNLAAFGVVGLIAANTGKETIASYKGLYKRNPYLSWVMALALFSLAGIPPTAGFFGKFYLVASGAGKGTYAFIIVAALNMIISLYYYLRVVRAMFMDSADEEIDAIPVSLITRIAFAICCAGILLLGFSGGLYDYIQHLVA